MAIEPCRTLGNHIVPHNRVGYRAFRNGWFPSACQLFGWRLNCLRSEEHTSELQSLMRISYAVFCLKKKNLLKTLTIHRHMLLYIMPSYLQHHIHTPNTLYNILHHFTLMYIAIIHSTA